MKGNSMSAEANVGVVGLAAMGGSLARNLAHHGNKVAVFNRTYARTEKLMNEHGTEGEFFPAKTLEEFVDSLAKPRTAIIMVKAGEPATPTSRTPSAAKRKSAPAACTSSAAACPVARKAPCSAPP